LTHTDLKMMIVAVAPITPRIRIANQIAVDGTCPGVKAIRTPGAAVTNPPYAEALVSWNNIMRPEMSLPTVTPS
jgi:hypothetical protein